MSISRSASVSTFRDLQRRNAEVYGYQNDIHLEKLDFAMKAHRYAGMAAKYWHQKKVQQIPTLVLWTFSWNLALANRMHIDLQEEVWNRFPGHCPYCGKVPHDYGNCKKWAEGRVVLPPSCARVQTVDEFQDMFARIYPNNNVSFAFLQFVNEPSEVCEALQLFNASHLPRDYEKVREECIDVVANTFAVANILGIRIADLHDEALKDGCPNCHLASCRCGITYPIGGQEVRSVSVTEITN